MLLVDTGVWSDHLRRHDASMAQLLHTTQVLTHPFVIGEIACGLFPRRSEVLQLLATLPSAMLLGQVELLSFIDRHALAGRGIGFVDCHLLASAMVAGSGLWTRNKSLAAAAASLGVRSQTTG